MSEQTGGGVHPLVVVLQANSNSFGVVGYPRDRCEMAVVPDPDYVS